MTKHHIPCLDLLIIDQTDPESLSPGGIDSIIRDVVRFSPQTVGIVGVSAERPIGEWARTTLAGREVHFLPVARLDRRAASPIPQSLVVAMGLLRFRRKLPSSYAHIHRVELGATYKLFVGRGFAQFIHNDIDGLLGRNSDSFWRKFPWLYKLLEQQAVRSADETICFSAVAATRLQTTSRRVRRQLSWVDPDLFYPTSEPHSDNRVLELVWVGRLDTQKDPLLAVRVLHEIAQKQSSVVLRMAGIGPLEPQVIELARELSINSQLEMIGALSRPEVADLLRRSDVLLMTSHYEGSPVVVVEAGATGLPIAAPIEADPDQVIESGVNGWTSLDRSPTSLAAAVLSAAALLPDRCAAAVSHRVAPAMVRRLPGIIVG